MGYMVNCKSCGKEIAKSVITCIHCGKDQRSFFRKHKILVVILAIVVLAGIGNALGGDKDKAGSKVTTAKPAVADTVKKETPKVEEKKVEAIKISAVDLASAYEANEVKADKDYKDKAIETTGKIDDIGVILGQTYVVLSSGKDFSLTNVQCFFKDKEQIDKIANLKKGGTVTIQGIVDGKSMNVGVNDCILK
jgi:hypothetical protein